MNRLYRLMLVLTVFAGLAAAGAFATTALQAKPTAVGVVDMQLVFNNADEKRKIEADVNIKGEENEKFRLEMQEKLRGMQADADLINPANTTEKEEAISNIRKAGVQARVEYEFRQQEIARDGVLRIQNLYRKILEACGDVAKSSGYDVVLYKESSEIPTAENLPQVLNMIGSRKVLYAGDELDITQDVIQRLNNTYNNRAE